MMERLGGVSSIRALASVKYMLEVGSAILIRLYEGGRLMLPTVLWLALFLFAIGFFLYIIRGINKNIFLLKML